MKTNGNNKNPFSRKVLFHRNEINQDNQNRCMILLVTINPIKKLRMLLPHCFVCTIRWCIILTECLYPASSEGCRTKKIPFKFDTIFVQVALEVYILYSFYIVVSIYPNQQRSDLNKTDDQFKRLKEKRTVLINRLRTLFVQLIVENYVSESYVGWIYRKCLQQLL